jgi:hypothetical protein
MAGGPGRGEALGAQRAAPGELITVALAVLAPFGGVAGALAGAGAVGAELVGGVVEVAGAGAVAALDPLGEADLQELLEPPVHRGP